MIFLYAYLAWLALGLIVIAYYDRPNWLYYKWLSEDPIPPVGGIIWVTCWPIIVYFMKQHKRFE